MSPQNILSDTFFYLIGHFSKLGMILPMLNTLLMGLMLSCFVFVVISELAIVNLDDLEDLMGILIIPLLCFTQCSHYLIGARDVRQV